MAAGRRRATIVSIRKVAAPREILASLPILAATLILTAAVPSDTLAQGATPSVPATPAAPIRPETAPEAARDVPSWRIDRSDSDPATFASSPIETGSLHCGPREYPKVIAHYLDRSVQVGPPRRGRAYNVKPLNLPRAVLRTSVLDSK